MGVTCEKQDGHDEREGASSSCSVSSGAEILESILKFVEELNMKVLQTKSQRIFGPARHIDCKWEPEKGCELFVGRIPYDCNELELVPFLEQAGPIFRIRLITDSTNIGAGTSRGYCFVTYFALEYAQAAVDKLHYSCIREGWPVVVNGNEKNVRLVLFGFPTYISAQQAATELSKFGPLLKVELVCDLSGSPPLPDQAVAYLTFGNQRAAAAARKRMLECRPFVLWGKLIYVDWAEPRGQLHPLPPQGPGPLNPGQDWSSVPEGSWNQVTEAAALPTFPQPVYPLVQPIYAMHPVIPVYFISDQIPLSSQGAEMSEEGPPGFFPGSANCSPPPFISAEEMLWVPSPSPSPLPLAQHIYWEGCAANENTLGTSLFSL